MTQNTWLGWVTTAIAAVLGLAGAWVGTRFQRGTPENRLIDQLQEELAARDKRITDLEASHADRIGRLEARQDRSEKREQILRDYISRLRRHIDTDQGPPAPDWPDGYWT